VELARIHTLQLQFEIFLRVRLRKLSSFKHSLALFARLNYDVRLCVNRFSQT